jgi:hypothetical protein
VGQHGPPFVRYIKDVSVAFLALIVFESGIGLLPILFVIIFIQNKDVYEQIFNAVPRFGVKEVKCVMGGGEMTVHTVGHKSLGVIGMR